MTEANLIIAQMERQGLLPLFFHKEASTCISIMKALYDAGIRIIEFTNRGDEARDNFVRMREARDTEIPDMLLGAGTIKSMQDAKNFIEAGADFIISPGINKEVGKLCIDSRILWVPGCMTPSEIMLAEATGATLVKLFPGNILGPGFVDAIRDLFPRLKFIPTGGVSIIADNLGSWFKSGVIAVGAGSTLISKSTIAAGNFDQIRRSTMEALKLVEESRIQNFRNH